MNASELYEAVKGYRGEAWFAALHLEYDEHARGEFGWMAGIGPGFFNYIPTELAEARIGWAVLGELEEYGDVKLQPAGGEGYVASVRDPENCGLWLHRRAPTRLQALLSALDAVKGAKRG